jgi:hypothetical protein
VGGLPRQGAGAAPDEDGREEAVLQVLHRLRLNTESAFPLPDPCFAL